MARKYTAVQIIGAILALFLPPVGVWFTEGFGIDFWINIVLCIIGFIPGSIHSIYVYLVWLERKWKTRHGEEVTTHPFLIFSKEFETRSRWAGNGQNGFFGYFDDNIKGGEGKANTVGGQVDPQQAQTLPPHGTAATGTTAAGTTTAAHDTISQQQTGTVHANNNYSNAV